MAKSIGFRAKMLVAATFLLTSAIPGGDAAAEQDGRGADLLGEETLVYAEICRPRVLLDRLTGDRVRGLLEAIPGYTQALDSPQFVEFRQVVDYIAGQLDTSWDEGLRALTGGGIVIGLEEADPPRLVLVLTPEDPEFLERAHDTLVDLARKDASDKGNPDPITQAEYRGLTAYSLSKDEAHLILDGRLVVANGSEALKAVVDRHLDGGDRLTNAPRYLERSPESLPLAWAFARLDRLRELDPNRFKAGDPDAGAMLLFGAWLELIETSPLATARIDWEEDRLTATLSVETPPEGRSELMALFLPPEADGAPTPIEVPGRIATINLWRDQEALWQFREEILPPEALQGLAQLDSFAGTFFGGRDFGDSVLAPIGTHWQVIAAMQDFEGLDPEPALKLPSVALVVELDDDRPEFAKRLRVAFQSVLGLVNLGGAETGAPPLMLGSETHQGVAISSATFMPIPGDDGPDAGDKGDEAAEVHYRHNYSPSIAEVEGRFILSSSIGLTRSLIDALKADPKSEPTDATLLMTVDGTVLGELVELNRERLILQNMLERGNDRASAERDVIALAALLRYLGNGSLRLSDGPDASTLTLTFALGSRP